MTIARVYHTGSQPNALTGTEQAASYVTAKVAPTRDDSKQQQNQNSSASAQPQQAERADDDAAHSNQDLTETIRDAQDYQSARLDTNETRLALDAAMADMKTEVLIQRGLVSDEMAQLLLDSRENGHQLLLARMDAYLEQRENASIQRGNPPGAFPPADRAMFQSMHDTLLNVFHNSGGDAPAALRAGAFFGQAAVARAGAASPTVQRWGVCAESFWKNFFNTPTMKRGTAQWKAVQALSQLGQSARWANSAYQNYVDDWQNFLADLDVQGAYLVDAQA